MNYTGKAYVLGIWFVYGWFTEDEINITITPYKEKLGDPWKLEFTTRKINDRKNFEASEDRKTKYAVDLKGDEVMMSAADLVTKMNQTAHTLAAGLKDSYYDHLILMLPGLESVKKMMLAGKHWLQFSLRKKNDDGSITELVPGTPEYIDFVNKLDS